MKKIISALLMSVALGTSLANSLLEAANANARGDYAAELEITRPLAASGVAWAQLNLGVSYISGQGVFQDYKEAAKWFRLAAAQGDASAQRNLGLLYNVGWGVIQDYKEAAKWFRLAAAQGDASAQLSLGALHEDGHGLVRDFKKAHMWFNVAAVKGGRDSVKARDNVATRMTSQQISAAQAMARQCIERKFKGCD